MPSAKLPVCFGRYERGDLACDGPPCFVRDRCVAFGFYAKELGSSRKDLLELHPGIRKPGYSLSKDEELGVELDKIIISRRIRDGKPHKVFESQFLGHSAHELISLFLKQLSFQTGRVVITGRASLAEEGSLFSLIRSGYVAIYGRPTDFTRVSVCAIYPRNRTSSLTIRVAAPFRGFGFEIDDHLFRTEFRRCRLGQLSEVARYIASAIDNDEIKMSRQ